MWAGFMAWCPSSIKYPGPVRSLTSSYQCPPETFWLTPAVVPITDIRMVKFTHEEQDI